MRCLLRRPRGVSSSSKSGSGSGEGSKTAVRMASASFRVCGETLREVVVFGGSSSVSRAGVIVVLLFMNSASGVFGVEDRMQRGTFFFHLL